jgi:hypothetical protein
MVKKDHHELSQRSRKLSSKAKTSSKKITLASPITPAQSRRFKQLSYALSRVSADNNWRLITSDKAKLTQTYTKMFVTNNNAKGKVLECDKASLFIDVMKDLCIMKTRTSELCRRRIDLDHLKCVFVDCSVNSFCGEFGDVSSGEEGGDEEERVEGDVEGREEGEGEGDLVTATLHMTLDSVPVGAMDDVEKVFDGMLRRK